jgi:di/tricarboxylate transporter
VLATLSLLVLTRIPPDVVLLGSVTLLVTVGVLDTQEAFQGLASNGTLTVAVLFVVAAGLQETGAVRLLASGLLGQAGSVRVALARLVVPTWIASAFLNNTPIVAALMPGVTQWAARHDVAASRLLLPLSYAAIIGGLCTLIGTSTNLVVAGQLEDLLATRPDLRPLGFFELGLVGLPIAVVGSAVMVAFGPWLLPDRRPALDASDDPRSFTTELTVPEGSPLIGKTIEAAGLRHLPQVFLAELIRDDRVHPAVPPTEVLEANDRLTFVGALDSVIEVQHTRGLTPVGTRNTRTDLRRVVEVVVAPHNPHVGQTVRDSRFRTTYGAVILAVARRRERLRGRLGDIVLQAGDVLLLEAGDGLQHLLEHPAHFYFVSELEGAAAPDRRRMAIALTILVVMVSATTIGWMTMLESGLVAAAALIFTGCLSLPQARKSIDGSVLVAIACAYGLGAAVQKSGLADLIAGQMMRAGAGDPTVGLVVTYLVTAVLTEIITNNAAALLAFPLAISLADRLGVSPMPFIVTVMVAASASFLTPIGYQTNLMVYGPGGYRFRDYLGLGGLLALSTAALTWALVPWFWPFTPA